jgi:CRP-like cAMP-binding protein
MSANIKSVLDYSPEQIADLLDDTNWSNHFNWEQIKCISQNFKLYRANAKEILFNQGEVDNSMGILLRGTIKVVKVTNNIKQLVATIRAPQTFGELSLIDGQPRSAYIIASTEADYLLITKIGLDRLADKHPLIAYQLLWKIAYILSQRFRNTSNQLAEAKKPVE